MQASLTLAAILWATATIAVPVPNYVGNSRKVTFECRNGDFLNGVESVHSNRHEDRAWKFSCGNNLGPFTSCTWTSWINRYDGKLTYRCPENSFIAGYESIYSNWHKDRTTQLRCCTNGWSKQRNCNWTGWVNGWDGKMAFWARNKAIAGWHSVHSNWYEDRRHQFLVCNY